MDQSFIPLLDIEIRVSRGDGLVFIEIQTERLDSSESLRSAGRSMAKANELNE